MKLKCYDLRRWQDRWQLRWHTYTHRIRHPLDWYFHNPLSELDEFHKALIIKRPICWVIGHDWGDIEVGEHWINSSIVVSDYQPICLRCMKWD